MFIAPRFTVRSFHSNSMLLSSRRELSCTKITMESSTGSEKTNENSEIQIPGKIKLKESTVTEREEKLKKLADQWKRERILKEELDRKMFGFTKNSEILNGRTAMFFLMTGFLTEIWTGQSIITQIDTLLRTLGIL